MSDQPAPLNAAQMQRVQAEMQKIVNDQALRKWCIEIAAQVIEEHEESKAAKDAGIASLIDLASQIYRFLNLKE